MIIPSKAAGKAVVQQRLQDLDRVVKEEVLRDDERIRSGTKILWWDLRDGVHERAHASGSGIRL